MTCVFKPRALVPTAVRLRPVLIFLFSRSLCDCHIGLTRLVSPQSYVGSLLQGGFQSKGAGLSPQRDGQVRQVRLFV
jgi:hypothetical protein